MNIINETDLRYIVSETLSLLLLHEICYKHNKSYKKLNESSYAENIDNEYYYDVNFDEVASLQNKLISMAYGLTKNMDAARELTQNTIVRAFEKSSLFKDGTNLLGWLRTIMTNIFRREMNNPRKKKMKYIDDYSTYNNADSDNDYEVNDDKANYSPEELIDQMKQAIGELSRKKGEIYSTIFQYKLNGKKIKDIAEELNLDFDKVKYYLRVIRKFLRERGFDAQVKKILDF